VVARRGQVRDGRMEALNDIFVRILGARGRKRSERDRENKRSFAEHFSLRVFGAATPR
jgi:hypothetical protein